MLTLQEASTKAVGLTQSTAMLRQHFIQWQVGEGSERRAQLTRSCDVWEVRKEIR